MNSTEKKSKRPRIIILSLDQLRERELQTESEDFDSFDDWPAQIPLDFNLDSIPSYNGPGDDESLDPSEGYGDDDENGL